ncbi:MAG: 3-keto-5-aminohexanoate cleavage protein [Rhodospirillaceae bacterium]|nr:3-keto-5-aminohexanoate cleavage protein [Rhodospirillaceae bacterium]
MNTRTPTPHDRPSVAIGIAPNGGRKLKSDHPAIPLSPHELAKTAAACRDAGAAMIHVHVRNAEGGHVLDAEAFQHAIAAIKDAVGSDLVIQMTTESLGLYAPPEQMAVVKAVHPEAISIALRELAPTSADEGGFSDFLTWVKTHTILPQIILYSPEDLARLNDMHDRGLIPWNDPPVLFVLGRYTVGQTSRPIDLLPFLEDALLRPSHWMTCAFGRFETACATAAALMGGHVRIGFENNLHLPDGSLAPDNAALVEATATALSACGLEISAAEALRADWHRLCA